jgi:catechol 2,3-dioxygenase-like lactoylglutathione lyase family enzyme
MVESPCPLFAKTHLQHLNILVTDLSIAWPFYRDVLGFTYGYALAVNKLVANFNGFEFFLEEERGWRGVDRRFHFGLRTDPEGVWAWKRRLYDHGIALIKGNNPIADIYADPDSNRVALYFSDPDGLTIEVYSPD